MDDKLLLKVENLKISFKNKKDYLQVVRGFDLEVNKGEIMGILGESGSGKTVSSNSIIGLIDKEEGKIDSGEIYFKGKDLLRLSEKELRKIRGRNISYIFQNPSESLNPYRRVGKQIEEALKVHGLKSSKKMILELMEDVGLDDPSLIYNMYPFQLSGGQCQRIMIAIGVICGPELLIADEPTSSIDASLRKKVLKLFKDINEKYGTSIIFITHDFDVAKFLCHKITIMYGGLVMEQGNMEDILKTPMHPYTRDLLRCVNSLDENQDVLFALEGRPPSPIEFKDECPFYERCKNRSDKCKKSIPEVMEYQNRKVRCINI
ncbi:ABC transporter ATP-binding protein [Wukongibacter baidiensis]|uniref:ABC transporter ATP-binding protein n=1 Tax=Wukongibacter baidiensis TaxID=1723361 RepID=UPI003D7FAA01